MPGAEQYHFTPPGLTVTIQRRIPLVSFGNMPRGQELLK
jgi:hypothetical protein